MSKKEMASLLNMLKCLMAFMLESKRDMNFCFTSEPPPYPPVTSCLCEIRPEPPLHCNFGYPRLIPHASFSCNLLA